MRLDFSRIVEENQSAILSLATRFLRDREKAQELGQDVFLDLYRQLDRIASPQHATWWLRRAICHRCIDEARKRKLRPHIALESVPEPSSRSADTDLLLNARLRELVSLLPEHARIVVLLRYQEDLSPTDIAETLGIPISTVKSQLHRSLAVLRGKLQRQEVCK